MNELYRLLHENNTQYRIFMPNEIFEDLKELKSKGVGHIAFAYSFYYFISWLYRYAKYGEMKIDTGMIKQVLGYSPDNKKVNYLIKENGWLDQIGYTYSDTDYPIAWEYKEDVTFHMLSDLDDELRKVIQNSRGKNYKIKVPVKGLWRDQISQVEGIENGTFYEIDYTHEIPFDVFARCMDRDSLGVVGFYLYGYVKYRCDKFNKYNSSFERIGNEVGMSRNTADKYLTALIREGLIGYEESECVIVEGKFVKQAHTYSLN